MWAAPEKAVFLIISSIFSQITIKFGLEVDENLLYRTQWSELKSDATGSVCLIKMIMIRYLAHLHDAHLFQCDVPNFNLFQWNLASTYLNSYSIERID